MSKKISISLHNSNLFLKEEFTENTSNVKTSNHAKEPLTEQEGFALFTNRWLERDFSDQLSSDNNVQYAQRRDRVRTSLTRQNKVIYDPETSFKERVALLGLARAKHSFEKSLIRPLIFSVPHIFLKDLNKRIRSGVSREFLLVTLNLIVFTVLAVVQRSNYGKSSVFPKAFIRDSFTTICKSKVPNLNSSCEESFWQYFKRIKPGYLYRYFVFPLNNKSKQSICLKQKSAQTKSTFLFENRSRAYIYFPDKKDSKSLIDVKAADNVTELLFTEHAKTEQNKKKSSAFVDGSFLRLSTFGIDNGELTGLSLPVQRTDSDLHGRVEFVMGTEKRPIKIRLKSTQNLYNDTKKRQLGKDFTLRRSQYYKPYYLSNQRIFVENDTIPAKRGTIRHKIDLLTLPGTKSYNISEKRSVFTVPESILKRCFYKYGFLLLWPSRKSIRSSALKKVDGDSFVEQSYMDSLLYNILKPSFSPQAHSDIVDLQVAASFLPLSPLRQKSIESLTCKSELFARSFPKASLLHTPGVSSVSSVPQLSDSLHVQKEALNAPLYQLECAKALLLQNNETLAKIKAPINVTKGLQKLNLRKGFVQETGKQSNKSGLHECFVCTSTCPTHPSYFLFGICKICLVHPESSEMCMEQSSGTKLDSVSELSLADSGSSVQQSFGEQVGSRDDTIPQNTVTASSSSPTELKKYEERSCLQKRSFCKNLLAYPEAEFEEDWQGSNTFTKNSFWHFIQDGLVRNTFVSGYQFPELNKKEIIALFLKKAVFNFSLDLSILNKKIFFPLSSYFSPRMVTKTKLLFNRVANKNSAFVLQSCRSKIDKRNIVPGLCKSFDSGTVGASAIRDSFATSKLLEPSINLEKRKYSTTSFAFADIKMQYTQVDLGEVEKIRHLFEKLGRDYEDYLRKPKDSLPALIISPSLENDREIEEEGIQIFRKRHLLQNKNTSNTSTEERDLERALYEDTPNEIFTEKFKVESPCKSEAFASNSVPLLESSSALSSETVEKGLTIDSAKSVSQSKKHQNMVKDALRQAQEEIDNIAKKEEKATDKEKQGLSIPPLTRLEALYTIRNRERKVEQAKDFTSRKGQQSRNGNDLQRISGSIQKQSFCTRTELQDYAKAQLLQSSFNKPSPDLPIFEGLSLYSDHEEQNSNLSKRDQLNFSYTPWLFSKYGDENLCSDRKHSFFGEISLGSKKISSQEQKQIFQQRTNPLLKTKFTKYKFTDKSKANKKNSELVKFKVRDIGGSRNRIYFYDKLRQNKACQSSLPQTKNTPLRSPVSHRVWQAKRMEPSTFRVYPRNGSLPIIPTISKEDWKKMMEWQLKKYFLEEDKRVLPLLSYKQRSFALSKQKPSFYKPQAKQWSSDNRSKINNKKLKIKKVYFYLPWIYCSKPTRISPKEISSMAYGPELFANKTLSFVKQSSLPVLTQRDQSISKLYRSELEKQTHVAATKDNLIEWPLTRLDLMSFSYSSQFKQPKVIVSYLSNNNANVLSSYKFNNYWQLPIQKNLFTLYGAPASYVSEFEKALFRGSRQLTQKNQKKSDEILFKTVQTKPRRQSGVIEPKDKLNSSLNIYKSNSSFRVTISTDRATESIVFEGVTKYSWLFIYTFFLALIFKQLFNFVYKVGLKEFFIKFLNSNFGRTITSEEFRYSIQNPVLTEFYMSNKRLEELYGLKSSKAQLLEIVWFLRNNCRGRNGPRGILLVGVPGTENVSVVQAIAGQANVPIITQSIEKIALDNEPQRQLEQLYRRAQKQAPCVLFLDQLDTIGARRDQLFRDDLAIDSDFIGYSTREEESVNKDLTSGNKLNVALRLLTILDGITKSTGVITMATAKDLDKLDPALLRPKRFDRRIYLSLPNQDDRIQFFKKQTQSIGHIKEMPWDYLSLRTESMSAIDIRSAINYSLFRAVLKNSVHTVETLEYGIDCVKSLTEPSITKNISFNTFKKIKLSRKNLNIIKLYKSFCLQKCS